MAMKGRQVQVKNRAPAPIQITAEQILREASDRREKEQKAPRRIITNKEELDQYRLHKRKDYEDSIRRQRHHLGTWVKYAQWEESQGDFARARSVFERALDVDYKSQTLWLKYAEMEMKHKFINRARNIWDRAVTLLPRVDQFWYKYSYMEEMIGDIEAARQVFERWMKWHPDDTAWYSYIKMEMRAGATENARKLYERYIECHPTIRGYIKFAKWEERQGNLGNARRVYERALEELHDDEKDEKLYITFAQFEERCREFERARVIYKYALDRIPKESAEELYKEFVAFEKKHGDRQGIEDVIIGKRRFQYEESLKDDSYNYDVWFDYIKLEESEGGSEKIREVYERAIANVPPVAEKRFWRRYIYLWINYALYEEMEAEDPDRTRQVYQECLKVIPHEAFTFSKIWIMCAHFEVRQRDLSAARKVFGHSIGRCPKEKLFEAYIEMEWMLGEVDRCRKLYEKYLEFAPHSCNAWRKYAEMESKCSESDRCRAIYELAVQQPVLDMPEVLWKAYIDFEVENEEIERARALYERLLRKTKHVKVWISYAQMESGQDSEKARPVYQRAYDELKSDGLKEERVMLLESWRKFELGQEDNKANIDAVNGKMPRKVKKKRLVHGDDGTEVGWEEYYDYIFPDDETKQGNLKILEMAHKWKQQKKRKAEAEPNSD